MMRQRERERERDQRTDLGAIYVGHAVNAPLNSSGWRANLTFPSLFSLIPVADQTQAYNVVSSNKLKRMEQQNAIFILF